jgi:hypothetical protein
MKKMDVERFECIMIKLKTAYGGKFPDLTDDVMDIWYDMLSDLECGRMDDAVKDYIQHKAFPPTIAELRDKYYNTIPKEKAKTADRFAEIPAEIRREYEELGIVDGQTLNVAQADDKQIKYLQQSGIL